MKNITAPAIIAKTEEKLSRLRASYACHDVLAAIAQLLRGEPLIRDGYHPTALDIAVNVIMILLPTSCYAHDGDSFRLTHADPDLARDFDALAAELEASEAADA